MFAPPPAVKAEVFTEIPATFRKRRARTAWADANALGRTLHSFLEGPVFERDGSLYVCDIPFGRIFRISLEGSWSLVAEYDGWPNGLAFAPDGRLLIADYRRGLLALDVPSGRIEPLAENVRSEGFRGLNDLVVAPNGDILFTDQGQTGLHDPAGRVYRLTQDGTLTCLLDRIPSPNGLAVSPDGALLYLAVTRANAVWRVPLLAGGVSKVGTFVQLSGGSGPDGLAMGAGGELAIAHFGLGTVWVTSRRGEPLLRVLAPAGEFTTNVAFAPDAPVIYITESETGSILRAPVPCDGLPTVRLA